MAYISSMKLPDNTVYDLKDSRVAVPVPADAVFTDHIYESKSAQEGGTELSLVTTGEKYNWSTNSEVVELTQAEYDALTEEEKMAGIVYLITDSPDNFLDEVLGNFASVEYTGISSKAYSVDDYLVLDNALYRVTASIAQGDTIAVGTNVIKTTVGDELATHNGTLGKILGDFASVESSTVASKSYAEGDFLVLNGYLYKAITAISQDDTFVEDTNIEKTTVDTELDKRPPYSIRTTSTTSTGDGACTCAWVVKEYAGLNTKRYVELFGRFSVSKKSYATVGSIFWGYYVDLTLPITLGSGSTRVVTAWMVGSGFSIPAGVGGNQTTTIRSYALSTVNGSSTAQTCVGHVHIFGIKPT